MSASTAIAQPVAGFSAPPVSVEIRARIEDVAENWLALERDHCVLASQKLGLTRAWIESGAVDPSDCIFLEVSSGGRPLAIVPLVRRRAYGVRMATWLFGDHLGSYAPLLDGGRWAQLSPDERSQVWRRAFGLIGNCDLVHLPDVAAPLAEETGLSAAFGARVQADSVHVARYADWESCDAQRRDKRRRKVDRQQGSKLTARGEVAFAIVCAGAEADDVVETMFHQRAERFRVQGIRDPFRSDTIKEFYKRAMREADGELHVLRLEGEVIAVRYNLRAGGGLFSLITSMHPSPDLQAGSPGKQNLLRAMQAALEAGYGFIDMGKGEGEEKRLWCNETVPLVTFTHALTPAGRLAAAGLSLGEQAKGAIKRRPELFEMYRRLRSRVGSFAG